jgi:hypothetical protein
MEKMINQSGINGFRVRRLIFFFARENIKDEKYSQFGN